MKAAESKRRAKEAKTLEKQRKSSVHEKFTAKEQANAVVYTAWMEKKKQLVLTGIQPRKVAEDELRRLAVAEVRPGWGIHIPCLIRLPTVHLHSIYVHIHQSSTFVITVRPGTHPLIHVQYIWKKSPIRHRHHHSELSCFIFPTPVSPLRV